MKYDLHIHTTCSDGKYSKLELLRYFNLNNYDVVSFTDHNYIELKSADVMNKEYEEQYNEKQKVEIIDGIEFDVSCKSWLHILGYDIKEKEDVFKKMKEVKEKNTLITLKIIDNIKKYYKIEIPKEELINKSLDGNITKSSITNYMVQKGYAKDYIEAGNLYTSINSPCFEQRYSLSIEEVIDLIKTTGGIPVFAHPYSIKLNNEELFKYISELKKIGLMGIEINNLDKTTKEQVEFLKKVSDQLKLYKSCGSDFHSEKTKHLGLTDDDSKEFIKVLRSGRK